MTQVISPTVKEEEGAWIDWMHVHIPFKLRYLYQKLPAYIPAMHPLRRTVKKIRLSLAGCLGVGHASYFGTIALTYHGPLAFIGTIMAILTVIAMIAHAGLAQE